MGASQSEPLLDQLSGYKILKKYPENNTTHLSHVQTDKQYLLRQLTYTDEGLFSKNLQQHKQRQAINDDHLTHLSRVQGKQIDHLCSNLYKVYAMWQYPYRTLSQEINQHIYQNRKFQDKQIWSILASSILALSTLQKNKIKHQMLTTRTILIDSEGLIKIADPLACGTPTNLQTVHRNRNSENIYLSPQQCEVLQSHGSYSNSYRSDVWSMAMIILECGLLQSMSKCYKDQYQRVDYDLIQSKLQQFGNQYGEILRSLVQTMLKKDSKDRPDWFDLEPFARKLQSEGSAYGSSKKQPSVLKSDKNSLSPLQKNDQSSYISFPHSIAKPNFNTTFEANNKVNAAYIPQTQRPSQQPYTSHLAPIPVYTNNLTAFQPTTIVPMNNVRPTTFQPNPAYTNYVSNPTMIVPTQYNIIQPTVNPTQVGNNFVYANTTRTYLPPGQGFINPNTIYSQPARDVYGSSTTSNYISPVGSIGFRPTQYSHSIGTTSMSNGNLFPSPITSTQLNTKQLDNWKSSIPTTAGTNLGTTNTLKSDVTKVDEYKQDYTKIDPLKKDYLQGISPSTTYSSSLPYYSPYTSTLTTPTSGLVGSKPSYTPPANQESLFTPPSLLYQTAQIVNVKNNQIHKKSMLDNLTGPSFNNKVQISGQTGFSSPTSPAVNLPQYPPQQKQQINIGSEAITKPLVPVSNNINSNNSSSLQRHIVTSQSNNQQTYVDYNHDNSNIQNQQILNQSRENANETPQFVIETFKQGSKYQGYKLKDMRHGQGKFYYQDGGMYDGNWRNNKMDGYGSLYYQSGELAYQGMWKQDQFQGKGKLYNQYPYNFQGSFNYQNFDEIDEYWTYYQGDFVQDFKKGKGKLMLSNGEYFEGTFENDMVEGPGVFYCKNGKTIKGVWKQNHLFSQ